jgi:hypothetical protein
MEKLNEEVDSAAGRAWAKDVQDNRDKINEIVEYLEQAEIEKQIECTTCSDRKIVTGQDDFFGWTYDEPCPDCNQE